MCVCVRVGVFGAVRGSVSGGEITRTWGIWGGYCARGLPSFPAAPNIVRIYLQRGGTRLRFTGATHREHAGLSHFLRKFNAMWIRGEVVVCPLGGYVRMRSG